MMKEENVFNYTDQAIGAQIQGIQSEIAGIRRQESDMVARRIELKRIKDASNCARPDLDAEMEDLWRRAMHFSNQIKDLESKVKTWTEIQDAGIYARTDEEKLNKRAKMAAVLHEQNIKNAANQLKSSTVAYKIVESVEKHTRRRPDMPLWAHVFPRAYGRKMLKRADRAIAAERAAQAEKEAERAAQVDDEIKLGNTISESLGMKTISEVLFGKPVAQPVVEKTVAEKPAADDEIKLGNTISESLGMKTISEVLFGKPVVAEPVAKQEVVAEKPVMPVLTADQLLNASNNPVNKMADELLASYKEHVADQAPVLEKPIMRKQILLAEKSVVAEKPVAAKRVLKHPVTATKTVAEQETSVNKIADEWIMSFAKIRADMEQKRAAEQAQDDAENRAKFAAATKAMFHLNEYMGNNIKTIGDILNEETQEIPAVANGDDFVILRGAEAAEYRNWQRMGKLRTFLNHGNHVTRKYDNVFTSAKPTATVEKVADNVAKIEPAAEPIAKPVVAEPVVKPVIEPIAKPVVEKIETERVAETIAENQAIRNSRINEFSVKSVRSRLAAFSDGKPVAEEPMTAEEAEVKQEREKYNTDQMQGMSAKMQDSMWNDLLAGGKGSR